MKALDYDPTRKPRKKKKNEKTSSFKRVMLKRRPQKAD